MKYPRRFTDRLSDEQIKEFIRKLYFRRENEVEISREDDGTVCAKVDFGVAHTETDVLTDFSSTLDKYKYEEWFKFLYDNFGEEYKIAYLEDHAKKLFG